MKPIRILLIDDDRSWADLVKNTLTMRFPAIPLSIIHCETMEDGLRRAAEGCDVILLDLILSMVWTATETAKKIPDLSKSAPVIVMSGKSMDGEPEIAANWVADLFIEYGAADFVPKSPGFEARCMGAINSAILRRMGETRRRSAAQAAP